MSTSERWYKGKRHCTIVSLMSSMRTIKVKWDNGDYDIVPMRMCWTQPRNIKGYGRLTFAELYENAIKEGNRRFGSDCPHTETKDGICLRCLRKVLDDDIRIST